MNTCNLSDKKRLMAYFLNRLDSDEMGLMQYHLMHCPECRNELEKMRLLAEGPDLNEEEDEDKEETIQPPVRRIPFYRKPFLRIAAMVTVVAMIAFGGYYFSMNRTPDIPVNTTPAPVYQSGDSIDLVRKHELDSIKKRQEDSLYRVRRDSTLSHDGLPR